MKVTCISDTHMQQVRVPDSDLIIHAGDLTNGGTKHEIERALDWLSQLHASRIILVPGNHDWLFQRDPDAAKKLCEERRIELLLDDCLAWNGLMVYGTPWQPWFLDWAFNAPQDAIEAADFLDEKWDRIPRDTDILITHCPPKYIGDGERHIGCERLARKVLDVNPMLHVYGHSHQGYGIRTSRMAHCPDSYRKGVSEGIGDTLYVNAAICNERCSAVNSPITITF